ncbi:TPA: polysaccharide pyruvyl transferase family protein, partial [Vibrio parahaemolyticus]
MKKKIGIATVTTGFNYGTSLQAFSTKRLLDKIDYEPELLKVKGSIVKGRDIRIKKLFVMVVRSILHKKNIFKLFVKGKKKSLSHVTKEMFFDFEEQYLSPKSMTWSSLKKIGSSQEYKAFLSGSDQVWIGTSLYPDPLYYLEFAPKRKRIAFSPSFGCSSVPYYNRKNIAKKISKFNAISTREESGVKLVYELTGRHSISLVDPTLMIDKHEWCDLFSLNERLISHPYILVYFLDNPSEKARKYIRELKEQLSVEVIGIPYEFISSVSDRHVDAGPKEFLNLVYNAEYVVTDSFHGTAFSLNFNTPFSTFDRNYNKGIDQSSRITSLLDKVNMLDRFDPEEINLESLNNEYIINFLVEEREKA